MWGCGYKCVGWAPLMGRGEDVDTVTGPYDQQSVDTARTA